MTQQASPNNKGFYAAIPRIVRTGYLNLTPTAKWIYVCLKDLCGEHGTCYRTLRVLAGEVGVSISTLSESIRTLRGAGLITADKQKRPGKPTAKETWHISIINIWEQNGQSYPVHKCSLSEQSNNETRGHEGECSTDEQATPQIVRSANGEASFCSLSEQQCSQNGTKEEEFKNDPFEETSIEEGMNAPAPPPPSPDSFSQSVDVSSNSDQETKPPDSDASELDLLRWLKKLGIHGSSDATKKAADLATILPHIKSKEDLVSLRDFASAELFSRYGEHRTAFLGNLADQLQHWLQSKAMLVSQEPPPIGMAEDGLRQVIDALPLCIPDSALEVFAVDEERTRFTLALRYGNGERDYEEILCIEDAPFIYGDPNLQAACMAFKEAS